MEAKKFSEEKIKSNINIYNRWAIIICSGLIGFTLIISWVLWVTIFDKEIAEILGIINKYITAHDFEFVITFKLLTIIILTFAVLMLIITTVPFIFLKNKGLITLLLGIVLFVLAGLCVTAMGYYFYFDYVYNKDLLNYIINYINSKQLLDVCFFFLPLVIIIINLFCVIILSLWLIIGIIFNRKGKITSQSSVLNLDHNFSPQTNTNIVAKKSSPFDENVNPPISFNDNRTTGYESTLQQPGINIVITNNSPQNSHLPVLPSQSNAVNDIVSNQEQKGDFATIANSRMLSNGNSTENIWTPQQIEAVWNKGAIIKNYDPVLYRKDYAGALMFRHAFVNNIVLNDEPESYNWTIVCQRPLTMGGKIELNNLQPLNNTNALTKGNNYPRWKTTISYNGKQNYLKQKSWKHKKKY